MIRLAVFATHPVQYQVPLWRELAAGGVVHPVVHYFSDASVRGEVDPGFGSRVAWDVPMLDGYQARFLARTPDIRPGISLRLRRARQLLRDGQFNAVLIAGYVHAFEWQIMLAARSLGIAIVMRGEFSDRVEGRPSMYRRRLRDLLLRQLYRRIDCFCVIGADAKDHLLRLGVPEERCFFSPYSVDSAHFEALACSTERATSRAQLGLGRDDFVVLFSGKFIWRKGVDILLASMRRLATAGDRRIKLIMVGDGPLRPLVEQARADIGAATVNIAGFVNQRSLGSYFAAADLFVLPSRHETWGLVVNEAMYFGLPVLITDNVGCGRDLVRSDAGLTIPRDDPDALATAIAQLAANPQMVRSMGERGRARIREYSTQASARGVEYAAAAAARSTVY